MTAGAVAVRRDGRISGALYLVVVLAGMFCLALRAVEAGRLDSPGPRRMRICSVPASPPSC